MPSSQLIYLGTLPGARTSCYLEKKSVFAGFDPPDGALCQNPNVMFVAMVAKLAVLISRGKVSDNWNCKTGLKLVLHVWTGGDC